MVKTIACCGFTPEYTFDLGMKEFSAWVLEELSKEKKPEGVSFDESIEELVARGMLLKGTK
jgi:hypothetical protein